MRWPCLPDNSRIEIHTFPVPSHQPTCNRVLCHSPVLTDELSLLPPLVHWVPFTLTYPVTFPLKSQPLCQASLMSSLLMGHCHHHNSHLLSSSPLSLLTLLAVIALRLLVVMNGCQCPLGYLFRWHGENRHPTSVLPASGRGHLYTGEGVGLSPHLKPHGTRDLVSVGNETDVSGTQKTIHTVWHRWSVCLC